MSHDYLLPNLKNLGDKFNLIFYDQRVCVNSDIEDDIESITIKNYLKDIDKLRKVLGFEKWNVMAHSWGELVAMKYAIKYPDNIKSLILVNSTGASSDINMPSNQELAKHFTEKDSIERLVILNSFEFQERRPEAIESLMKLGFRHQFYIETIIDSLHLSIRENYIQTSKLF